MLLSKAYQLLSNLIQNIAKFLIRYKEFYIKTTTKNLELIIYKKLTSKLMQKDEHYKISKIMIVLYHGKVSTNSLAMTTQFLWMSICRIFMLKNYQKFYQLLTNRIHNIDEFLIILLETCIFINKTLKKAYQDKKQ